MLEIEVKIQAPHTAQKTILATRKRFNAIKCGRRFGKTFLSDRLISEVIKIKGFVGFWTPTYKDLYEVWQQCKQTFHDIISGKDESIKQLRFIGGSKIDFWSMEDPDSGRGRMYHRAIIDECEKAGKFQQAWEQTIRATLTDFKGDAYLFSTPQIGLTYFKEVCKHEKIHNDWKTFIYPTSANPHIDPEEIEQARLLLPDAIFRTEYLAEDVDAMALNPFAYQYKVEKHESREAVFQPQKQIIISTDFNINPFAAIFLHIWRDGKGWHRHQFDEMEIANGSIPEMIDRVKAKYGSWLHAAVLTGDAMGSRGEISERDNASLYMQLLRGWNMSKAQLRVSGNPTHKNSRADVNFVLFHHEDFKFNPDACPMTCRDMRSVQCDSYGQILKRDRKDLNQRADFLDCTRYEVDNFHKDFIRERQSMSRNGLYLQTA